MRLIYNILWIEDDSASLESKKVEIEEYLNEHGFILKLETNKDGNMPAEYNYNIFDVIAVDCNLENNKKGHDVIKEIRKGNLYTEILFYSLDGDVVLRKKIAETGCDGIYCSSRDGAVEALKKLIYTTIKKSQDINNIRGLIIGETTDIEVKMCDIAKKIHEKTGEEELKSIIKSAIDKHIVSGQKKVENITSKYLEKADLVGFFDSIHSNHVNYREEIKKALISTDYSDHMELLDEYETEVVPIRNDMAHAKEVDGKLINSSNRPPRAFTMDDCKKYRKVILKHQNNLGEIEKHLLD